MCYFSHVGAGGPGGPCFSEGSFPSNTGVTRSAFVGVESGASCVWRFLDECRVRVMGAAPSRTEQMFGYQAAVRPTKTETKLLFCCVCNCFDVLVKIKTKHMLFAAKIKLSLQQKVSSSCAKSEDDPLSYFEEKACASNFVCTRRSGLIGHFNQIYLVRAGGKNKFSSPECVLHGKSGQLKLVMLFHRWHGILGGICTRTKLMSSPKMHRSGWVLTVETKSLMWFVKDNKKQNVRMCPACVPLSSFSGLNTTAFVRGARMSVCARQLM